MHVLLLALNYHPDKLGNAPLMTGLAEGLAARGHRVTVVTALPHHETGAVEGGRFVERERRAGVEIIRTWLYAPAGGRGARTAGYLSFTVTALAAAVTVRGVDVILTPSPPLTLGLVDALLARAWRVPYVYNVQDLFPEAPVRLGLIRNRVLIAALERLERRVYRGASRVAVISEAFRGHVARAGVAEGRIAYVPNFADVDFITPQDRVKTALRDSLRWYDAFVVQFSGRMGYSQGLETVIEAWHRLDDIDDMRLMMVGDGQAQPMVAEALRGDPRAVVLPTQPRECLPDLLASADVGLAPLKRGMAATCIPSKVFGIMAAARPVVAGVEAETETARLIAGAGAGLVVPPEDPGALADAIRALYVDRRRGVVMGAAGRTYVMAHHARDAIVARYERLLLEAIADP